MILNTPFYQKGGDCHETCQIIIFSARFVKKYQRQTNQNNETQRVYVL